MSEQPSGGQVVFGLVMVVWSIMCMVWQIRNPTANPMTCITRIGHCMSFDRMAEYQVSETHTSMPQPHPDL